MRLNPSAWRYAAAVSWVVFTVGLAVWWLIFGLGQARALGAIEGQEAAELGRVTRMLLWEGAALVLLLISGGVALVVAIRAEQRRRQDMRAFFMAFTHDLKTSLASLLLQAEVLREDLPGAAENPNLVRLLKDAVRLQLQLENALFFTRTDGAVFIEPLDVGAMVDQLREDWPELTIEVTGAARVAADRRALDSILRNLLQNAVVHGRANAVGIDIRKTGDGRVEITVADDGVGAVAAAATALERPFVRPSPTSGSGVGLYVCRGLAGQMQGRIRLLGEAPRGFAVAIELPEAA